MNDCRSQAEREASVTYTSQRAYYRQRYFEKVKIPGFFNAHRGEVFDDRLMALLQAYFDDYIKCMSSMEPKPKIETRWTDFSQHGIEIIYNGELVCTLTTN